MASQQERPSPDEINAAYRAGLITAAERNDKMRRLAGENLEDVIENQGMVRTYYTETVKHLQVQWDEFLELVDSYKPPKDNSVAGAVGETVEVFKNAGRLLWNMVGAAMAPLNAFQEVNGATARRWAQDAGASPGLSALIGTVANVGSGFVPIGRVYRTFAKAVQKNVPELAEAGKKIAGAGKGAGDAKEAAEAAKQAATAAKIADEAVARGLLDDGVKLEGLEGFVDDAQKLMEPQKALPPVDDFYKSLRKYHDEIKGVTETKHLKDIEGEAQQLGYTLDDLRGLGEKPLTPAQIKAYLNTLDKPTNDLIDNARNVLKGDPDAGMRQDQLLGDYFSYTPKFRRSEVEAGRTVKVLDADPRMKSITNMMAAWAPEEMAKLDLNAARRLVAEDIVALADEADKLKTMQLMAAGETEKHAPSFWNKMRSAYVNLLLLRPVTAVKNFLGNTYAAGNSALEREIGAWLSIDDTKGLVAGEGYHQLKGMQAAMADAFSAWGKAFKGMGADDAGRLDFALDRLGGPLGRIINSGGDNLRGMDNFFKTLLRSGDLYAQAFNQGSHMGMKGKELMDYVYRRVRVPTNAMMQHADDFALNQTFQNDLGTLGKAAQRIGQAGPLVYLFPFMKTPMNLAKYAWNRTPGLNLISKSLYDDILAGGARADSAIARLTLSTMMGQFWFQLAQEGVITGGGPADPQLKRSWGKVPYSFRGPDGWYQPGQLDPGTTPMWLMADYAEVLNQLDDPTAEQTAMAISLAATRDIVDKSYWQTVGQAVELISAFRAGEEPGQHASRIIQGPLITAGTGGPVTAGIARSMDPVRRETRGFLDQVRGRVPGWSDDLPPMRDGYGDPVMPPQPLGSSWVGNFLPQTFKEFEADEVKKEGTRLQVKLPMFPWGFGGRMRDDFDVRTALPGEKLPVELSPKQRDRWQVIYRNIMRGEGTGIKEKLLDTEEYKGATWAAQREMFMNYMAKARATAKDLLIGEDKDLQAKTVKSEAAGILPFLNEADQAKAKAAERQALDAIPGSLDLLDSMSETERENIMRWGILDTGEKRDQEVIRGVRAEIGKPIGELNEAARQQGQ